MNNPIYLLIKNNINTIEIEIKKNYNTFTKFQVKFSYFFRTFRIEFKFDNSFKGKNSNKHKFKINIY